MTAAATVHGQHIARLLEARARIDAQLHALMPKAPRPALHTAPAADTWLEAAHRNRVHLDQRIRTHGPHITHRRAA